MAISTKQHNLYLFCAKTGDLSEYTTQILNYQIVVDSSSAKNCDDLESTLTQQFFVYSHRRTHFLLFC